MPALELPKIEPPELDVRVPRVGMPSALRNLRAPEIPKNVQEGPARSVNELRRLTKDLGKVSRDVRRNVGRSDLNVDRARSVLQDIADRASSLAATLPAAMTDVAERLPDQVAERVPAVRERRRNRTVTRLVIGGLVVGIALFVVSKMASMLTASRRQEALDETTIRDTAYLNGTTAYGVQNAEPMDEVLVREAVERVTSGPDTVLADSSLTTDEHDLSETIAGVEGQRPDRES